MIPEYFDTTPVVAVQENEYKRLLGFPPHYELEGRSKELADWASEWYAKNGKPWIYARAVDSIQVDRNSFHLDGTEFTSKKIIDQWNQASVDSAVIAAVSAGMECEEKARELWLAQKPDEYFFMEVYGSAVVEHLIARAGFHICESADQQGVAVLPHYSPGYPDWNISDQKNLWNVITNGASHSIEYLLMVMDSGMLRPKKSLLGVFGITQQCEKVKSLSALIPCENCSLSGCRYRRIPYKNYLPEIDSVHMLGPGEIKNQTLPGKVKYSFSEKVLQKWSDERLHLQKTNGSIKAQFRYEGTTCSNMGLPLLFDYHVSLDSSNDGYMISGMKCHPVQGETHYETMCEYRERGDEFIEKISDDAPLLGKPLNDIFRWKRQYSPSGCYCLPSSRDYKWGIVFEVLHFALVKHRK